MDKEIIKRILQITIGFTIGAVLILLFLKTDVLSQEGIKKLSTVFTGIILFWTFYFSVGWKWPIVKYLVLKENLNGTWFGEYKSEDYKTGKISRGEIAIVIRQSFLNINVTSYTDKYIAFSFGEAILHNKSSDSHQLVYLYSQNQYNPIDDIARKGTSELHLLVEADKNKLFGKFWTNYSSKGNLKIVKITNKQVKSFHDAKKHSNEI